MKTLICTGQGNEPGLAALRMPVMDALIVLPTVPEAELFPDDEF